MTPKSSIRLLFLGAALLAVLAFAAPSPAVAGDLESAQLGLKVKLTLLEKLGADALRIDVDAHGNVITLNGVVNKRATAELAETVAENVPGVKSVDEHLELKEYKEEGKTAVAATETERSLKDALLEVKLRAALIDAVGSDGLKIGTDAASGTVTLEFPKDLAKPTRTKAEAAAQRVAGVTKVVTIEKS
jgi:osmotically-inducible protein OsmY